MKLTKQQTQHIANLARLDLSEDELETYGGQLSDVLGHINQLKEVDTSGEEPTAQVTGLENVLRDDTVEAWNEQEIENSLKQTSELEDNQIKVKRVLE